MGLKWLSLGHAEGKPLLVVMVGWLERQTLSKATSTLVRSEIWLLWYDLPKKTQYQSVKE